MQELPQQRNLTLQDLFPWGFQSFTRAVASVMPVGTDSLQPVQFRRINPQLAVFLALPGNLPAFDES